ncbi:MAG TPA: hypothetical protein VK831_04750 [Candidatus Deferrimicrobiaceae bacterium]|nr:hypothetical protein [Candidatus Deferrimicrobiaceae bacterium]
MAAGPPHRDSPERAADEVRGPLARATAIGLVGATVLVLVGGVLASTAGLLVVAGATGAGIGLALARAAVASPTGATEAPPMSRRSAARWSIGAASIAVLLGAAGTWLVARSEGGTLGLFEYVWTTFGWFVPAELVVAALAAAWGARAGPVVR